MLVEKKSIEEVWKSTGRRIILKSDKVCEPYLGLYEEHGNIDNQDYLRYGVRYIGNKTLKSKFNERIVFGEILGEFIKADKLIQNNLKYCFTELNSSLHWVWRSRNSNLMIDTRDGTGILSFVQRTWKDSSDSNCQLEVIDNKFYITSLPNIYIYPGDELVLSVKNNMDLIMATFGDQLMRARIKNKVSYQQSINHYSYIESPASYETHTGGTSPDILDTSNISRYNIKKQADASNNFFYNDHSIRNWIHYTINCRNGSNCTFCGDIIGSVSKKYISWVYKNALVFIIDNSEFKGYGLSNSQIKWLDQWKSISNEKKLYKLLSIYNISTEPKAEFVNNIQEIKENKIDCCEDEILTNFKDSDINCNKYNNPKVVNKHLDSDKFLRPLSNENLSIDALLVQGYISNEECSQDLISEFQMLDEEFSDKSSYKCYLSKPVFLYFFFDKWILKQQNSDYIIRIPIPLEIEHQVNLLMPYPYGIKWHAESRSWRYYFACSSKYFVSGNYESYNSGKYLQSLNCTTESTKNFQNQEYISVSPLFEDHYGLIKSYFAICSIKLKYEQQKVLIYENSDNLAYMSHDFYLKKNKKPKYFETGEVITNKSNLNSYLGYDETLENCVQNSIQSFNSLSAESFKNSIPYSPVEFMDEIYVKSNEKVDSMILDEHEIIRQAEILLVPPYSSNIKFCSKRFGFQIMYNKKRAWFSVKSRGVLEAFNLAVKWLRKQREANAKAQKYKRKMDNNFSGDSDKDSIASFTEQANRLKPFPKRIIWVPSRRVFIVSYRRSGEFSQINTKSFNPAIYGGVKKALKQACIFQSQTELKGKYTTMNKMNKSEKSLFQDEDHLCKKLMSAYKGTSKRGIDALKSLSHWVKKIGPQASPEIVTNAYREAVSTYITQPTVLLQSLSLSNANHSDVNNEHTFTSNSHNYEISYSNSSENSKTNDQNTLIHPVYLDTDLIIKNETYSNTTLNEPINMDINNYHDIIGNNLKCTSLVFFNKHDFYDELKLTEPLVSSSDPRLLFQKEDNFEFNFQFTSPSPFENIDLFTLIEP
ncbi:uncharacterized protein CMU_031500 [Cryptosporidium muris RN66]|uniref:Uncharacterized protein n=1 Tax=Cryptosporidium muris (strain RN66) TaxID=441375 RepID=B6AIG8_CRYMR|nr:uncharacterized protein CMU_031500 [Cryptosporidium muris RN66]EEA08009.1 hypothetical protein, conserved [Cryptosporidium muris RN66]|eukprot:XP_002142358.1 hypothetical protein [Cryptosporidium muris RN66]